MFEWLISDPVASSGDDVGIILKRAGSGWWGWDLLWFAPGH